jgi:hypothetical protein
MPAPIAVFISFVQEDDALREALEAHLSALRRAEVISTWSDRRIDPGETFRNTVDARVEAAKVILLLVSADFLASDYCNDVEVARALERAHAKEALVILVRLRACDQSLPQFERLPVLPRNGQAVTSWPNRDEAWAEVAHGLRDMIGELAGGALPTPPPSASFLPPPDAPYDQRFYVHRAEEEKRALAKLATPGAPVVIWGPWLSGKSWMLGYLLERIQEADKTARLWDVKDGKALATLQDHADDVQAVAFSPDGTRVVTGSADTTVRLWDAKAGKLLATLQGHTSTVCAVAFSPDGTRVVTGSLDKTARLWNANDGQPLAALPGHGGAVTFVSFSSDGRHITTATNDGTARIWPATPEGYLIQACQYLHPWPAYAKVADTCAPYVDTTP